MAALAIYAVTAALLKDRTDTQAPPPATPDNYPDGSDAPPQTRLSGAGFTVPACRVAPQGKFGDLLGPRAGAWPSWGIDRRA
jgi:hypothetical protein